MYLTENHLIFAKEDKDEISRRWEIIIPLAAVVLNWKSEVEERKGYIKWEGTTVDNFGFGSGFLRKAGDQYHMVIPYLDEQGTSQYPRFNVSSASHWAAQLYIKSVKTKMVNPRQNISENDTSQTISNCFNCTEKSLIYEMKVRAHCNTVFCSMCENNHSIECEVKYHSKYLGGHKLYPKSADTEFFIFSDRIEIPQINLRITYFSMTNIENADEKKISALRVVGLGIVFLLYNLRY
jgi:hypothetical protein